MFHVWTHTTEGGVRGGTPAPRRLQVLLLRDGVAPRQDLARDVGGSLAQPRLLQYLAQPLELQITQVIAISFLEDERQPIAAATTGCMIMILLAATAVLVGSTSTW